MTLRSRSRSGPRGDRAVSSAIGLALVFAMIVAGTVVVLAAGAAAIDDTTGSLGGDRAEKVLTQLDSQAAMVALGNSRVQRVPLTGSRSGSFAVREDSGWMNVTVTNASDGSTDTLMNTTLGELRYSDGIRTVAYQGGGVWKERSGGAVMVSPPEFYYRDATLTLPLVTVDGADRIDQEAIVTKDGSSLRRFPNASIDENRTNPLAGGTVTVSVRSDYYRAWGTYFEQRTEGDATFDHENETVTLTLVVPAGEQRVRSAVAATSAAGELSLSGSGSSTTRTDSYNSSQGSYDDTNTDEGTVATAGDVSVKGNSIVEGSVESGGFVEVKGSGEVTRDVYYADGKHIRGTVGGTIEQIEGVEGTGPIDTVVASRYDDINATNDNDNVSAIGGDALDSGDRTLESGRYHLDEIELDGETLTLDTGDDGDPIHVGVRDYVRVHNGGRIEVNGTSEVRFYMDGGATTADGNHVEVASSGGVVDVLDAENSSKFWIYGRQDLSAEIDGKNDDSIDHRFEGVIYAPGGEIGSSSFRIEKGELYGGVVTGNVEMANGGAIHYDQALRDVRAVPADESIVRLTYLHVSENPINVTSP